MTCLGFNYTIFDTGWEDTEHFTLEIDTHSLNTTYRNNKIICDYANSIYPNYNPCNCIDHNVTGHDGVFFISPQNIDEYLQRFSPMQLRDTIKTKVNYDYPYMNFGESKGLTFGRVLIYPTKPMLEWITDKKPWNCQEICSLRIPKILDRQESGSMMSQPS